MNLITLAILYHAIKIKTKFTERWMPDYQVENIVALYEDNELANVPGLVVELGCWQGYSTRGILNSIYPEQLQVVDHFQGNIDESPMEITVLLSKERNIEKEFKTNMKLTTKENYQLHKQDCIAWLEGSDDEIKFCHVDASHDYSSVFRTISALKHRMVPGGIICGDDFQMQSVAMAVNDSLNNFETDGHNLWWTIYEDI